MSLLRKRPLYPCASDSLSQPHYRGGEFKVILFLRSYKILFHLSLSKTFYFIATAAPLAVFWRTLFKVDSLP
jgi:hypothetical protein